MSALSQINQEFICFFPLPTSIVLGKLLKHSGPQFVYKMGMIVLSTGYRRFLRSWKE